MTRSRARLLGACLLAGAGTACWQGGPTFAPSGAWRVSAVPVTEPGYHDETSVALDPTREGHVLASWQVPATVGLSRDGGRSWDSRPLPGVRDFELAGDPSVAFSADGTAYALFIAFDRPGDYSYLGRKAHRNGIFLSRSEDGGITWDDRSAAVVFHREQEGIPFEDKPMMGIDRSRDSPYRGRLYVAWTQFLSRESRILFARSEDGGRSFERPVVISDRAGSPKDTVGADEGTDVEVAADGTVYVVWSDSAGIRLDRSTDGGRSFGADRLVQRTPDIVFGIPGISRANGYPSLEIGPDGTLYVQWVDRREGPADVWITRSEDGGESWSAPLRVDGRALGTDSTPANHFFAWLSADPLTGWLVSGYYRETDGGRLSYRLAVSADGGRTFVRRRWSASGFRPRGEFIGDYSGVDARGGTAVAAWTEADRPPRPTGGGGAGEEGAGAGPPVSRVVVGRVEGLASR